MNADELAKVAAKLPLSESTLARNAAQPAAMQPAVVVTPGKRIRQSSKPLLNKLETAWAEVLRRQYTGCTIHAQAIRFKLANGSWYKVDFCCLATRTCWEVKGPHAFRGGFEALKCAATLYPEFTWWLVWKEAGQWQKQQVMP